MEIELVETTLETFCIYDQDDSMSSYLTSRCEISKTEYGSVIIKVGNGISKGDTLEYYPSAIKVIKYAR
jgi:hypothetical protein